MAQELTVSHTLIQWAIDLSDSKQWWNNSKTRLTTVHFGVAWFSGVTVGLCTSVNGIGLTLII